MEFNSAFKGLIKYTMFESVELTNKMYPFNKIYYSKVY